MPLHGLIHDSVLLHYARRGLHHALPRASVRGRSPIGFNIVVSKLVIYKPILNFELNSRYGMVGKHMHILANRIAMGARRQVGVDTGALRKSIKINHFEGSRGQSVHIGSDLSYAYMHHEGTVPHVIRPNPPRTVLRFRSGSRVIYTPVVNHPGTKPNRYLSDQLRLFIK